MSISIRNSYRLMFILMLLSLFCLSSTAASNEQPNAGSNYAQSVYNSLKTKYSSFKSYQANLITEVTVTKDVELRLSGEISIEFPDKWLIKLESGGKKKQKICYFSLSDGKNIWQLDSSLNLILKTQFNKSSKITGHFFPIFSTYNDKNLKIEKFGEYEILSMKMEKGGKDEIFSSVEIFINPKENEITRLRFIGLDSLSKMTISFSNIKTNCKLPENIFAFNPVSNIKVKEYK